MAKYVRRLSGAAVGGAVIASLDCWYPRELAQTLREDGFPNTFWADHCTEQHLPRKTLQGTTLTDVVIVGGGLAGLHCALSLAEKGKKVVVLEQNLIGAGASGMSKGLAVSGLQVDEDDVAKTTGAHTAARISEYTEEGQTRLLHLIKKYGIDCEAKRLGGAQVSAFAPPQDIDLSESPYLSESAVQSLTGSPLYKWGSHEPETYGLNPLGLTRGLARACESLGVVIHENSSAMQIIHNGERRTKRVMTKGGEVECSEVVLCAAASLSPKLNSKLSYGTVPCYTYMAATEPLGERLPLQDKVVDNVVTPAPLICDDFLALNYFRKTDDGRLLFGALADMYPTTKENAEIRVRAALEQVYPTLKDVKFDYFWGGTLCMGRNAVPLIGKVDDIWHAVGFGGHGIVPTCMAGEMLAEAIVNRDETYKIFETNFPPSYCGYPFSRLGGGLAIAGFGMLDAIRLRGFWTPDIPRPW